VQVLYLSTHPHLRTDAPSGYATHMRETIRALRLAGCTVVPCVVGDQGPLVPVVPPAGGGLRGVARSVTPRFVWQGLRDLALLRHDRRTEEDIAKTIEREQPDAIYERAAYLCASGVRAARAVGVPLVLEVNAPYVEERRELHGRGLLDGRGPRWEREVLHGASLVVTVSTALADRLRETSGVPADKIRVLPNAVDAAKFSTTVSADRARLGFADEDFVIGFVGTFFRWHRLESLVHAVAALRERGVPARALLIGDGEALGGLEEAARDAGVASFVEFTGSVVGSAVPGYLQSADVCVVPGHAWYCSPIKLFEYAGLRKPVVAVDSAPIREVTGDGSDVVLVDGSAEALVDALAGLHADPARRAATAAALHDRVLANHTWARSGEKIAGWLRALRAE